MNSNDKRNWSFPIALRVALLMLALSLAGCGGGSSGNGGSTQSSASSSSSSSMGGIVLRALPTDFSNRKAIAYSPYRGATLSVIPTDQQILQDLQLLYAQGFRMIRVYDAGIVIQRVLGQLAIHPELDIKVVLGIWITGPSNDSNYAATNQTNMDEGVRVALDSRFSAVIVAVSVGNETMLGTGLRSTELSANIRYVRNRVPQPVTTDDVYGFYAGQMSDKPLTVLREIDFVAMHTYAWFDAAYNVWDWKQTSVSASARAGAMMNAAMTWTRANFATARTYVDNNGFTQLPIVIGETGWKTIPSNNEIYFAHPVNQKMFYDLLRAWDAEPKTRTEPTAIFYFEAFDEPWKGSDDNWGLWNVDRLARYALWSNSLTGFNMNTDEPLPLPPNDVAVYYTGI